MTTAIATAPHPTASAPEAAAGGDDIEVTRSRPLLRKILSRFESSARAEMPRNRRKRHLAAVPSLEEVASDKGTDDNTDNPDTDEDRPSLVLLGGGGHSGEVLALVEALAEQGEIKGPVYVADDTWHDAARFEDRPVEFKQIESIEAGIDLGDHVVTAGSPMARRALAERAASGGGKAATALFHPGSSMAADFEAGEGVVVMGDTLISAEVTVGAHTHLGRGANVGREAKVGAWCSIMPGACIGEEVTVGDGVLVGAGATILEGLTIGADTMIAPGATVISDVEPGSTVLGTPARPVAARTMA